MNKKRISSGHRLQIDDCVRIPFFLHKPMPKPPSFTPSHLQDWEKWVVFEDDTLLVFNKPAGIPVHSGSGVAWGVIDVLRQMRPQASSLDLVHRLDRGTSGCLLLSKSHQATQALQGLWRERLVEKEYLVWVAGVWVDSNRVMTHRLQKTHDQQGQHRTEVSEYGQFASTRFELIQRHTNHSLLKAWPKTGRMHQIRVHAATAGCPVVGDHKYGYQGTARRLYLHAHRLSFHWQGQAHHFEASLDDDWYDVIDHQELR